MNTKILRNAAKILIAEEYADAWSLASNGQVLIHWEESELDGITERCNPFGECSASRCQADEINNWLHKNQQLLLLQCANSVQRPPLSEHNTLNYRRVKLEWCLDNIKSFDIP